MDQKSRMAQECVLSSPAKKASHQVDRSIGGCKATLVMIWYDLRHSWSVKWLWVVRAMEAFGKILLIQ